MKKIFSLIAVCFCISGFSQNVNDPIHISDDIDIVKISDKVYVHKSYRMSEQWGRVSANGVIYTNKKEAFIFDTPWTIEQTETLISWISESLQTEVVGFIPNHWHVDCIGGMECIKEHNIKSYANQMTIEIAKEKELPFPKKGFKDSLKIQLGDKHIECYYLGAAHSHDNIIVWVPSEQLLFAGCVLKGLSYNIIGFTGDGDLKEYPKTLEKVLSKFPEAKIIVPGHGEYGGIEMIHHNIKLANKAL